MKSLLKVTRSFLVFGASLAILSALAGCSTIYFKNGDAINVRGDYEHWHHVAALELVEFETFDLKQHCESDWKFVKTNLEAPHAVLWAVIGRLYSPWNVEYSCKK